MKAKIYETVPADCYGTFEAVLQKKSSLVKAKKALAGMVGKSYTLELATQNSETRP